MEEKAGNCSPRRFDKQQLKIQAGQGTNNFQGFPYWLWWEIHLLPPVPKFILHNIPKSVVCAQPSRTHLFHGCFMKFIQIQSVDPFFCAKDDVLIWKINRKGLFPSHFGRFQMQTWNNFINCFLSQPITKHNIISPLVSGCIHEVAQLIFKGQPSKTLEKQAPIWKTPKLKPETNLECEELIFWALTHSWTHTAFHTFKLEFMDIQKCNEGSKWYQQL